MKLLLRFLRKFFLLKNFNLIGTNPSHKSIKIPVIKSIGYSHYFEEEPWTLQCKIGLIDEVVGIKEIRSIGIHSEITNVNYLFFPEEKGEALGSLLNLF